MYAVMQGCVGLCNALKCSAEAMFTFIVDVYYGWEL